MSVLSIERLELKYLIDEAVAARVRAAILPYCEPDRTEGDGHGCGYGVLSLYFDTPTLAFHRARLDDDEERLKLRVRRYDGGGATFLEIKRKRGAIIVKRRAAVAPEDWPLAVDARAGPLQPSAVAEQTIQSFATLRARTGAEPRLLVHYLREAYASTVDRYARVTFDRAMRAQPRRDYDLDAVPDAWRPLDGDFLTDGAFSPLVLELKVETRLPRWLVQVVRDHGLEAKGYSKYSAGIALTTRTDAGHAPPAVHHDLWAP